MLFTDHIFVKHLRLSDRLPDRFRQQFSDNTTDVGVRKVATPGSVMSLWNINSPTLVMEPFLQIILLRFTHLCTESGISAGSTLPEEQILQHKHNKNIIDEKENILAFLVPEILAWVSGHGYPQS